MPRPNVVDVRPAGRATGQRQAPPRKYRLRPGALGAAQEIARPYCTVRIAVPFTPFMVALMVAVPAAALVASPFALIVATLTLEEVHAACPVMPMTEPSLNVPAALNCCEAPTLMLALAGVTAIEFSVALVTVTVAVPTCPLNTAEIVALPGATPVARPILP